MATTQVRGLQYPLQIDSRGQLILTQDLAIVEQNIISVLETRPFERVMRATYGFDPGIFDTMEPTAISAHIAAAVEQEVPAVTNLEVDGQVNAAESTFQVTLRYGVNGIPAPPLDLTLNI
jgi:phage baseplate assembly protein W